MVRLQLVVKVVHPTQRLVEELGAESVEIVNLVAALETKFGILVSESDIARITTVSDLINLVKDFRK